MSLASISVNINFKDFFATSFIAIFKDDISLGGDILKPIYQSSIGDDT